MAVDGVGIHKVLVGASPRPWGPLTHGRYHPKGFVRLSSPAAGAVPKLNLPKNPVRAVARTPRPLTEATERWATTASSQH